MTQEEFDSLVQRVTNALQGSSKMVTDLRVVKSPVGVNLLPGVLGGELVALEAASLMGTVKPHCLKLVLFLPDWKQMPLLCCQEQTHPVILFMK